MLQRVVMCSSVLQHVAVVENQLEKEEMRVAVCCNVLQRVAVYLQWRLLWEISLRRRSSLFFQKNKKTVGII